jgi:hemin uptake protein HemP
MDTEDEGARLTGRTSGSSAANHDSLTEYKSSELFQGKNELIIRHAKEQYRLRITRHGKLILTK